MTHLPQIAFELTSQSSWCFLKICSSGSLFGLEIAFHGGGVCKNGGDWLQKSGLGGEAESLGCGRTRKPLGPPPRGGQLRHLHFWKERAIPPNPAQHPLQFGQLPCGGYQPSHACFAASEIAICENITASPFYTTTAAKYATMSAKEA